MAQQPVTDDLRPDAGALTAGVYTNPYFNFSYKLPVQWNGRVIQKSLAGQPQRFYQMMNALPANATASIQYMGIQAEDINGTSAKTARDFLVASPIFAPTSSYTSVAPVIETVISGRTFARADFKSKPSQDDLGLIMYQTQLVTLVNHFAITISFTADDRNALDQLVPSVNSLAFNVPAAAPAVVMASAPAPTAVPVSMSKGGPSKPSAQPVATGATVEMSISDNPVASKPIDAPASVTSAPETAPATVSANPTSQPAVTASSAPVTTAAATKPAKPSAGIPLETSSDNAAAASSTSAAANTQPAPVLIASTVPHAGTSTPAPETTVSTPAKTDSTMTVTDSDTAPAIAVSGVTKLSEGRVRLSEGVLTDYIFSRSGLSYPQQAKDQNIEGKVVIGVVITMDGHVKTVKLVSGPPQLAGAAMDSVRNWRFIPYLDNGHPMEVESQVSINFTLKH